ncbi:hypothetical protein Ddye_029939 [Dipteronia dyeriana]|uniref:RNase H type-1 domain-containing protein n=1 Tax=Dipteronia dyeriana TaxID=168575 RepID=A0AAD9WM08_9ROSI|nr:hypothetical protein Ddye_029939 [Dipteronia dyeriana]
MKTIKVPPKVKSFLRKACKNWLPTTFNLAGRGVPTEMLCLGYSKRRETTSHALWCCDTLKGIRLSCPFTAGPKWRDDVDFKDLFLFYKHVLGVEDMELLCIVWMRWFLGPQADKQLVGVGLIVRQSNGLVSVASAQCFTACFSPPVAEAVAILRGLQCVVNCGFYPVVLESDAKWVVDLINSGNETQAESGAIVEDIMAAHVLAKDGLRSCPDQVWYEEVPHWLESVCCLDSSE